MPSKNPRFSSPVTVLLADANPSYREITRKMLKFYDANFLVDDCASIADCLKMAKSHAYDLIISEEILEDGDSFGLLQALKREKIDTPVMVLFAEGHEDRALAAIEAGAIDYITKARGYLTALPFTVKKILEKRRTQQTRQRRASVGPPESTLTQKGYFILNHQGKFLSANPGMESLTGYSEDELLELTLLDLLPKGQE
ncbi:MAG: response regulator, partial [Calditrichaeota bacterium]